MQSEAEGNAGEQRDDARSGARHSSRERLFPYNSVVGVVDNPDQLDATVKDLVDHGVAESEVFVLCGKEGIETIDATGKRKGLLARVFRMVDGMGEEREHTAHHVRELEAGHFIVGAEVADQAAKERAVNALKSHGAHFINYYSRWSTEDLVP